MADPVPTVIARLSALAGPVGITAAGAFAPYPADGRPLSGGERIETGAGARALLRLGSTALRIGPSADLKLGTLDDRQVVIELGSGSIGVRVVAADWAQRLLIVTPEGHWSATRPGHYRFDRWGDTTRTTAWEGEARFDSQARTLRLDAGRRVELWFKPADGSIEVAWGDPVADEFADWVIRDARAEAEAAALQHVAPEVIGWEDLDAHGDWRAHPQWGSVWIPRDVGADWAPHTGGRWTWSPPWGWVWLNPMPWAFAPSHYGRWAQWRGRWVWIPGPRNEQPRFRPAPPEAGLPPRQQPSPPFPAPASRPPWAQPPRPLTASTPAPAPLPTPASGAPPTLHAPSMRDRPVLPPGRRDADRPNVPGPTPMPTAPERSRVVPRPDLPGVPPPAPAVVAAPAASRPVALPGPAVKAPTSPALPPAPAGEHQRPVAPAANAPEASPKPPPVSAGNRVRPS